LPFRLLFLFLLMLLFLFPLLHCIYLHEIHTHTHSSNTDTHSHSCRRPETDRDRVCTRQRSLSRSLHCMHEFKLLWPLFQLWLSLGLLNPANQIGVPPKDSQLDWGSGSGLCQESGLCIFFIKLKKDKQKNIMLVFMVFHIPII